MKFNRRRNLFFPYLLFNYPSPEVFSNLFEAAQDHADLIEIGIPFSDPVADGPVIQTAITKVLSRPFHLEDVFEFLAARKKRTRVALMTYANPILNLGAEQFFSNCRTAKVDACIIPDVPFEESEPWRTEANRFNLPLITFVSLLTSPDRLAKIAAAAEGFIYLLSLTGVTGSQIRAETAIRQQAGRIKQITDVPVALGFGIRSAADAVQYSLDVDAFIVGSRIIEILSASDSVEQAIAFIREFNNSLKMNGTDQEKH
jgi:tryptophan synthase alpha chain